MIQSSDLGKTRSVLQAQPYIQCAGKPISSTIVFSKSKICSCSLMPAFKTRNSWNKDYSSKQVMSFKTYTGLKNMRTVMMKFVYIVSSWSYQHKHKAFLISPHHKDRRETWQVSTPISSFTTFNMFQTMEEVAWSWLTSLQTPLRRGLGTQKVLSQLSRTEALL